MWGLVNGTLDQYAADAVYMEMIHQQPVSQNSNMNGIESALHCAGLQFDL